jgi:hypothetical protein
VSPARAVAWVFVLGGCAVLACVLPADVVGGTGGGTESDAVADDGGTVSGTAEPCGGFECTCEASTCHQTCATSGEASGGCIFGCDGEKDCHFECMGGACQSSCTNGAECQFDCVSGGCVGDCTNAGSCANTCEAGGCQIDCDGTDICELSCVGGGCTLGCSGASVCRITECEAGCVLDCGGAATCENSCDVVTGCITQP